VHGFDLSKFMALPNAALHAAAWSALVAALVAVVLLADTWLLQYLVARRAQRARVVTARWRAVLLAALNGEPPPAVSVPRAQVRVFLHEWNAMHESARGDARAGLDQLLRMADLPRHCRAWLRRPGARRLVLALRTLGHLAEGDDWSAVRPHLDDVRGNVALAAARALMRIDDARSAPLILQTFSRRSDWPAAAVYDMLADATSPAVGESVREWLLELPAGRLVRALTVAAAVFAPPVSNAVLRLLRTASDPDVLAACLRLTDAPQALDRIRELAVHPSWPVRVQAANALERLGQSEDISLLTWLLGDDSWWVRYRAARALMHLPGGSGATLRAMADSYPDPRVREILSFVVAEERHG